MDTRRRVAVGDTIELALPGTDVCHHLQVANHIRTVRLVEDGVQILNDDGSDRWKPISHADAGVLSDSDGLYVEPLPDTVRQVFQHGKPVSGYMTSDIAPLAWWQRNVRHCSADHAIRYEGYEVKEVPRQDTHPETPQADQAEARSTPPSET